MNEKEKAIKNYMKKLNISREEAEQLFEDDENDFIGEDGEKMTAAAKQTQHREKSDNKRKSATKERKIDADKKYIFESVLNMFESMQIENIITDVSSKTETEVNFVYNGAQYTCKLTKHRPPKK